MIRKRFPKDRRRRIAAWTAVAIAWSTAIVARTVGAPAAAVQPNAPEAITPPPSPGTTIPTTTLAPVPDMPQDGLVVLRYTPAPQPAPEVRRVIVSSPAAGGNVTASAPTRKASSGS